MVTGSAVEAGFRWVAEWEKHEATWIAWPHNAKTWPGKFTNIPRVTERLVRTLAEVEHVHILGGTPDTHPHFFCDGDPKTLVDFPMAGIITHEPMIR